MKIAFTKVEGSGNDFILIDNRDSRIPALKKSIKRKLCSRRTGIGADGILLLEKNREFPFMMRYYNADGSEAKMCGNGARCVALYAFLKGFVSRRFSFRSKSGVHKAQIFKNNMVKVELTTCEFKGKVTLRIAKRKFDGIFLKIGVPHLVIFMKNIENIDVLHIGKKIRNLKRFSPEGTNVDFVKIEDKNKLSIRTYERGVEGETFSCGTGAAAVSAVAYREKGFSSPIYVNPFSGETIVVSLKEAKGKLIPHLTAKARIVFSGTVEV